jgi:hypothetical protein
MVNLPRILYFEVFLEQLYELNGGSIKDAHNQEKENKRNGKQRPDAVINTRNNNTLTTTKDDTWTAKGVLQNDVCKKETMKAGPWPFNLEM